LTVSQGKVGAQNRWGGKIETSVDGNKCAKNCCKQTIPVQLIVEDVVTCFLEHSVDTRLAATRQRRRHAYTLRVKKLDSFSFEHNFPKYCPILLIISLLQTEIICPHICNWISHFTYSFVAALPWKMQPHTQTLLNKYAMHAVISLLLHNRKFWWYLLLTSSMLLHDVIVTSYCCQRYAECLVTILFQQNRAPAHRACVRATVELLRQ